MDLTRSERPKRRTTPGGRLACYALVTVVICAIASIVGEELFPAELRGDTGGNDFAGLAAIVWAVGAFASCVAVAAIYEVLRRSRRRGSDVGHR